jgi:Zn-dependent protease with chaperone function
MNGLVALPLLVVVASVLLGSPLLERLRPASAVRYNSILLAAALAAAIPTLWLLGFGGLARLGIRTPVLDWCHTFLPQDRVVGTGIGLVALVLAVVGTVRVARVLSLHRRLRVSGGCRFTMIETDDVFAYTLPGPAGTIAVSRGLRNSLNDTEYEVVLAHEEAHARHRHDRFLLVALLTRAFIPALASVTRRLEFHIERWADEDAVAETGAARALAARTIAKVALATTPSPALLGIASHGTVARAAALLQPAAAPTNLVRLQAVATTGLIVAIATLQILSTTALATQLVM